MPTPESFSRLPATCLPAKPHTCFRTLPDGRIPLERDVRALLAAARALSELALQTRHPGARLVAMGPMPEFDWCERRRLALSADGALALRLNGTQTTWGRLGCCDCCGSPGRVEVHGAPGNEFLQFSAPPGCEPGGWSEFLSPWQAPFPPPPASPGPLQTVQVPAGSVSVRGPVEMVAPFLSALAGTDTPCAFTLRTPESRHTRMAVPLRLDVVDEILTSGQDRTVMQLALPVARALAFGAGPAGEVLHVVGADRALLFSFGSPTRAPERGRWRAALLSVFPELRSLLSS